MAERKGVMLAKKMTPALLAKMPEQVYFQPKINGMRCRAKLIKGKVWLFSSQGNVINSVPHINEQMLKLYPDSGGLGGIRQYDGELCGRDLSIQEIGGICRKTTRIDKRSKMISFHIFDLIDGFKQEKRFKILFTLEVERISALSCVEIVGTDYGTKTEWELRCDEYIRLGYEGLIIRNPNALYQPKRTADLLKVKAIKNGRFKIIGAFQADAVQGVQTNMLGGLVLVSRALKMFNCGCGCLTHEERRAYWHLHWYSEGLIGKTAVINYPELTDRGIPFQPILQRIED